eukprot:sb/3472266/
MQRTAPIWMKLGQNSLWWHGKFQIILKSFLRVPLKLLAGISDLRMMEDSYWGTRLGFFELTSESYVIERFVTTIIDAKFNAEKDDTKDYSDQVSIKIGAVLFHFKHAKTGILRTEKYYTVGPRFSAPDLVTPRFSDTINFPRYRKLTSFDPDLVAPRFSAQNPFPRGCH